MHSAYVNHNIKIMIILEFSKFLPSKSVVDSIPDVLYNNLL
jgi:hypothetical protein